MRQRKDVVARDASLGGCISGAVGGRYGLRGVYRGSYPSRITQTGRPERGRLRGDIRLCGAVGVEKPSQAIGRVQVERGRPVRLPQRRLPERQLRGPSDVDGDAGNASAEGEGVGRGAAGDSAPSEPPQQSAAYSQPPPRGPLLRLARRGTRTAASLRALMGGRRTTMASYAARRWAPSAIDALRQRLAGERAAWHRAPPGCAPLQPAPFREAERPRPIRPPNTPRKLRARAPRRCAR